MTEQPHIGRAMVQQRKVAPEHGSQKLRHFVISFFVSVALVGVLVGNVHMAMNMWYPDFLQPIAESLLWIGLVLSFPPAGLLWVLSKLGIVWDFPARESLTNIWVLIYGVASYSFAIYYILRVIHWITQRDRVMK